MNEYYRNNGVYAYASEIPQTYTTSKTVHFVSGDNGDEFGQFETQQQAIDKAVEMAKFSEAERKQFDQ